MNVVNNFRNIFSREFFRSHRLEIAIFLVALIIRLVLFTINFSHNGFNLVNTIHGDDGYYEISQGLLNGHGFTGSTAPPFTPNPLRPPVWPFMIAILVKIFGTYWAVLAAELLMGSLIPVLGMHVAREIMASRYAKAVGWLLAFEPYSVLLSFVLYTETCFTFLFLIFLLFLFRYVRHQSYRNAVWAGMFLGLATLVKPTVEYFPIIIPLVLLFILRKNLNYRIGRHLLAFLLVFLSLIAPWLYRNHVEYSVWGMSAQPAFNLYVYLVPTVLSIDNHTSMSTEVANFVTKGGFDVNSINLSNAKYYKDQALAVLKQHKLALLKSSVITAATFFTNDGMLTVLEYSGITFNTVNLKPAFYLVTHPAELVRTIGQYAVSPAIIILAMRLVWIILTLLSLVGVVAYLRKEGARATWLTSVIIVAYFTATTAINGLGVNARFRDPVLVFIFSFAVYGFHAIKKPIKELIFKRHFDHEAIHTHTML